jgi:hypothetical protein
MSTSDEEDPAGGDVVKTGQETGDGGLAARGGADDRDGLTRWHDEVEAVEDRRPVAVGEGHALEAQLTAAVAGQFRRAGRIDDGGVGVEQLVDTSRGGRRARRLGNEHPHEA